jgi:hypothetical protein
MGFRIFRHAIRMVFTQFGSALRISGLLYLVSLAVSFGLAFLAASQAAAVPPGSPPTPAWDTIVSGLIALALYFWIAIGWHRFVLLDEQPLQAAPRFHGDRMLAYLGRVAQTFLILLLPLCAILVGMTFMVVAAKWNESFTVLAPVAGMFVALFFSYRLSPMLPGAAVSRRVGIAEAWKATSGSSWTVFGLMVMTAVAAVAVDIPGNALLLQPNGLWFGLIWLSVTGWIKLMVGVSIITTIYGVYVEQRQIA